MLHENFTLVYIVPTVVALLLFLWLRSSRHPYSPGPKGSFIVGNAWQMPKEREWLTYHEWSKKWGDIIYVSIFGKPLVILNSHQIAVDLLDRRSAIYSTRPVLTMAELSGFGEGVVFSPYNDRLKQIRKAVHKALNAETIRNDFRPVLEAEVRGCLARILEKPDDFEAHAMRMATAVIVKVIYGYDVQDNHDPLIRVIENANEAFSVVTRSGAFLVDFMPILKHIPAWLPGAGFKRLAKSLRGYGRAQAEVPYTWTKQQLSEGTAVPSFTTKLIDLKIDEDVIMWTASGLFGGASDTVVAAILSFILVMTLYPDIQAKVHEEIDRVIGQERLPDYTDQESLPYLEACRKELLRWNTVVPLGIPHALTQDDIYNGYLIPKGTVVVPNAWGMLHDERLYKNPDRFMPASGEPEIDPSEIAFGYGRRRCPGMHFAKDELYLAVAQIGATFKISKALDAMGREIEPKVVYTNATVSRPEDFKCRIEPRFEGIERLVRVH